MYHFPDYQELKDLVGGRPVGIYLGCPKEGLDFNNQENSQLYDLAPTKSFNSWKSNPCMPGQSAG